METRTFYGISVATAMRDIRKALGPDAVILSTRSLPSHVGILLPEGRATVAVMAEFDAPSPAGSARAAGTRPANTGSSAKRRAFVADTPNPADRFIPASSRSERPRAIASANILREVKAPRGLSGQEPYQEESPSGNPHGALRPSGLVAAYPTLLPDNGNNLAPDTVLPARHFRKRLLEQGVDEILINRIIEHMHFTGNSGAARVDSDYPKPESFVARCADPRLAGARLAGYPQGDNGGGRHSTPQAAEDGAGSPPGTFGQFVQVVQGFVPLLPSPPKTFQGKARKRALIGPTGVGKTTTVAKIASRLALQENRQVVLVTLDTYRIAAAEQIKTYARLLGVPLEVIADPEKLQAGLEQFADADDILIDTPGFSPKDTAALSRMAAAFRGHPDIEIHLLITCPTRGDEMRRIIERFHPVGFDRLIFSKLDEAALLGDLLNTWIMGGYPVSYFTTGQRVPEDLEPAQTDLLCRGLLAPPE